MTAAPVAMPWSPFASIGRIVALPRDRQLQVFEQGSGEPLLYLHGFGLQQGWNPMLDVLAANRRVIAPLFAGFGESTGVEDLDEMLDVVVYLNDVLDALGVDSVDVVGLDLGGMFAAELAAASRARVRRLVLIAPFGLWEQDDPTADPFAEPASKLPSLLFSDPESEAAKAYGAVPDSPEDILELTVQRTRALAASTRFLWPIPDRGLHKRIHAITAPTTVIWGEQDRLIPASYANRFASAIEGARVELLDGGHLLPFEAPEATADAVLRALAQSRDP